MRPDRERRILEIKMTGQVTFDELLSGHEKVLELCRKHGLNKILGDATEISVHPSSNEVSAFMNLLPANMKYASFTRPGQANMDLKFAEVIATNNGLKARVFNSKENALAWLKSNEV